MTRAGSVHLIINGFINPQSTVFCVGVEWNLSLDIYLVFLGDDVGVPFVFGFLCGGRIEGKPKSKPQLFGSTRILRHVQVCQPSTELSRRS